MRSPGPPACGFNLFPLRPSSCSPRALPHIGTKTGRVDGASTSSPTREPGQPRSGDKEPPGLFRFVPCGHLRTRCRGSKAYCRATTWWCPSRTRVPVYRSLAGSGPVVVDNHLGHPGAARRPAWLARAADSCTSRPTRCNGSMMTALDRGRPSPAVAVLRLEGRLRPAPLWPTRTRRHCLGGDPLGPTTTTLYWTARTSSSRRMSSRSFVTNLWPGARCPLYGDGGNVTRSGCPWTTTARASSWSPPAVARARCTKPIGAARKAHTRD